jgi:hypothetical protein
MNWIPERITCNACYYSQNTESDCEFLLLIIIQLHIISNFRVNPPNDQAHLPVPQRLRRFYFCFCGFASRKSFTIGTIVVMRCISVTCVVSGNMANLDAERGRRSP